MSDEHHCCEVWPKICGYFGWMVMPDGTYLMPHVECVTAKYRVNFCPSCGRDLSGVETTRDAVKQSREEMPLWTGDC